MRSPHTLSCCRMRKSACGTTQLTPQVSIVAWAQSLMADDSLPTNPSVVGHLTLAHSATLQHALQISPHIIHAALRAAQRYHRSKLYARAGDLYAQITTLDPYRTQAWFLLGNTCQARKDICAASACYSLVLRLDPQHAAAQSLYAECLAWTGHTQRACALLEQSLAQPLWPQAHSLVRKRARKTLRLLQQQPRSTAQPAHHNHPEEVL